MTPSNRLFEAVINRNERAALSILDGQDILPLAEVSYLDNTYSLASIIANYASDKVLQAFIDRYPVKKGSRPVEWGVVSNDRGWETFCVELARTGRLDTLRQLNDAGGLSDSQLITLLETAIEARHIELVDYLKKFTWFSVNNRMNNKEVLKSAIEADDVAWFEYLLDNDVWTNVYFDEEETETIFYRAVTQGAWRIAERIVTHLSGRLPTGMRPDKAVNAFAYTLDSYNIMRPETNEQADIVAYGLLKDNGESIRNKNVKITLGDPISNCIDQGLVRTLKYAIKTDLFDFTNKPKTDLLLKAMRSEHFNIEMIELLAASKLSEGADSLLYDQTVESRDYARHTAIMMLIDGQNYESDEIHGLLGRAAPITYRVQSVLESIEDDKSAIETFNKMMDKLAKTVNVYGSYGETVTIDGDAPRNFATEMRTLMDDMLDKYSDQIGELPQETKDLYLQAALSAGLKNYEVLLKEGADPNYADRSYALKELNRAVHLERVTSNYWLQAFETLKAYGMDPIILQENTLNKERPIYSANELLTDHPSLLKTQFESGFYMKAPDDEDPSPFTSEKELESLVLILNYQQNLNLNCPLESTQDDSAYISKLLLDIFELEEKRKNDYERISEHLQRSVVFDTNGATNMSAEDLTLAIINTLPAALKHEGAEVYDPSVNRFAETAISELKDGAYSGKYLQMLRHSAATPNKPVQFINKDGAETYADSFGVYMLRRVSETLRDANIASEDELRAVKANISRLSSLVDFNGTCHDDGRSTPYYAMRLGAEVFHELRDSMKAESFNVIDELQQTAFDLLPESDDHSFWKYRQLTAVRTIRQQKYVGKIMTQLLNRKDTLPEVTESIHNNIDRLIIDDEMQAEFKKDILKFGQPKKRRAGARL